MNQPLINNHYSSIALSPLKSNNFKLPLPIHAVSLQGAKAKKVERKGIERSFFIEISQYSEQLLKSPQSKESQIIDSKKIILKEKEEIKTKTSYFDKVDMLRNTKEKEGIKTIIQKYLRSFTTLDIELAQNQNTLYEFHTRTLNLNILNKNVYNILESSFFEMSSVISRPYYYVTPKFVIINLFYFVMNKKLGTKNFLEVNLLKLEGLSAKLSKYFKKPIKLELTQLYSVSNNSQILVNILGRLRRNSFARIIGRFLKYQSKKIFFRNNQNRFSKVSTTLTGVNIKLGGRLMRGKIVPRRTVKKIQYGSLARSKSNYITTARYTNKNKRGSFSFTVSIGHKFF